MKFRIFLLGFFVFMSSQDMCAQKINKEFLKEFSHEQEIIFYKNKLRAIQYAEQYGYPIQIPSENRERVAHLFGITENNQLLYASVFNEQAAITTGANKIQNGGSYNLNLSGSGMIVGIWDEGVPLTTHVELEGKIQNRDGSSESNHATHVTGTIMAKGIRADARGMAFASRSKNYNFENFLSEIAVEASQNLLISNHSWGIVGGWHEGEWLGNENISTLEDYTFGFYTDKSEGIDNIIYNAKQHLLVIAAGNDRDDSGDGSHPPDGNQGTGYDCIGPLGLSKNVLTVGSVSAVLDYEGPQSIEVASYSGWGPVDDGRIKPDLVADGQNVLSSSADGGYEILSGTSMATPNATGSLVLVQELYKKLHPDYLLAASIKGLAIHTTLEAGANFGPDYQHGWGLLSVDRMVNVILRENDENYLIEENTLQNNEIYTIQFEADGNAPIVATICWTDVSGTPVSAQLDPRDPMLMNDLDLRIIDPNGQEFFPWKLNPVNPPAAATQGDNIVDNIERINIQNPIPGQYRLLVTHKGSLIGNEQDYTLILTTKTLDDDKNTLYWIGGSGNWSDGENWSLSSGGEAANQIPGVNDRVIIDENSLSDGDIINLDINPTCYALLWSKSNEAALQMNGNTIEVVTSLNILSDNLSLVGSGTIRFTGSNDIKYLYIQTKADLSNLNFQFGSLENNTWFLESDLNVGSILMEGGAFHSNGHHIRTGMINAAGGDEKELILAGITVDGLETLSLDNEFLNIDLTGTTFIFSEDAENAMLLGATGKIFHKIVLPEGELILFGENRYNNLRIEGGELIFDQNNVIDSIFAAPQTVLTLKAGFSQEITSVFDVIGEEGQRIMLRKQNDGDDPILFSNTIRRVCLDYLQIESVDAGGSSEFVVGENSLLNAESNGWVEDACENLLFADFQARFTCVDGITTFTNLSTGSISAQTWSFGVDNVTSEQENPTFTYTEAGDYEVTLEVSDGIETKSFTKTIEIRSVNNISKPEIILLDNILRSSISSQNHQWYLDGEPIPGANNFFYVFQEVGSYTIEVSNNKCKYISDPFIVNVINDQLENKVLIYPNPTNNDLKVKFLERYLNDVEIQICDLLGKVYFKDIIKSNNTHEIDLQNLQKGVYVLRMQLDNKWYQKKIVKW